MHYPGKMLALKRIQGDDVENYFQVQCNAVFTMEPANG